MDDIEMAPNSRPVENVTSQETSASESLLAPKKWISGSNRTQTNLDDVLIESRPIQRAHLFRRPRGLQYHRPKDGATSSTPNLTNIASNESEGDGKGEELSTDGLADLRKQLRRSDLFVDLVWVGIIANLSRTFEKGAFSHSGISIGLAFLECMLLFIPIWRIWDNLRAFGSNFYNDDVFQRQFMTWILILAVLYGINAPDVFHPDGSRSSLKLMITIYLIAQASFLAGHLLQCIFLPFLRRQFIVIACDTFIGAGLWIAALFVSYPGKIVLLVLANVIEQPVAVLMASPLGDRLITGGWKRSIHIEHYVERYEGFFIIILGEGVFRLIEGSPSGFGLNNNTGTVLCALLMYHMLHRLYFNGDQAKQYVHAVRRTWWRPVLWQMYHVFMFAALLVLAASVSFLVQHGEEASSPVVTARASDVTLSPEDVKHFVVYAFWSASISLSVVILCMTHITILNRPLDKAKTLLVNARWIRLLPRIPVMVVILCLPLFESLSGVTWCGASVAVLYFLFVWEWIAGLDRNWQFLEPKDKE